MNQEIRNFRDSYLTLLNTTVRGVRRSIEQKDFATAEILVDALNYMFYNSCFQVDKQLVSEEEMDAVKSKICAVEKYLDEMKP